MNKTHSNNILSGVVQDNSKKYNNLKMFVLRETFDEDYAVLCTERWKTQPATNKMYQKTIVILITQIFIENL